MAYLHYFSDQACPFCKHVADFQLLHAAPLCTEVKHKNGREKYRETDSQFRGLFLCSHCRSPSILDFSRKPDVNNVYGGILPQPFGMYLNRLMPLDADNKQSNPSNYRVLAIKNPESFGIDLNTCCIVQNSYPREETESPSDLPQEIQSLYIELEAVRNSPRYTCVACRSIIEAVCKATLNKKSKNLSEGIDNLVLDGMLPKSMADWAHEIRLVGNAAVHEPGSISSEEASEIRDYTRMLLELMYSYPARIARRRGNA